MRVFGWWVSPLGLIACWVLAMTVVTFLTFGYDKSMAGTKKPRVPENVLLALTFFGGTIGAVAGASVFRHKTRKSSFRTRFIFVVGVQALLVGVYYFLAD